MLNKYESFTKSSKSSQCSIYTAFNRQTANSVLLKRVKTCLTWKEILCHKHILLINRIKIFPKINEIFKHKGHFYFVFDKPYGNSLSILNSVEKNPLPSFIQLMADLTESAWQVSLKVNNLVILPEWAYFHLNTIRLVHFQPFLQPQLRQQNHVATHETKLEETKPLILDQAQGADFVPEDYKRNVVFNIGLMAFRLATGKKEENVKSTQEYYQYIRKIRQSCQRQVIRATGDQRIASFLTKMLTPNKFQIPTLQQVNNFFQSKSRQLKKTALRNPLTVEIQIQKINLKTVRKQNVYQKKTRQPKLPVKDNQRMTNRLIFKSENKLSMIKKSKLLLPQLFIESRPQNLLTKPQSVRSKNLSTINRHNPFLRSAQKHIPYRQHIKSVETFKNEELV